MKRFDGKVAIVTGAGESIGSASARRLASECALVVVTDVNAEAASAVTAELVEEGYLVQALTADITDKQACFRLVEQAHSL